MKKAMVGMAASNALFGTPKTKIMIPEEVLKAIQQRAEKYVEEYFIDSDGEEIDSASQSFKDGAKFGYELREEQVKRLTEALEYLMEGVSGLPPLTAIAGTLVKHFEKAKQALKQ